MLPKSQQNQSKYALSEPRSALIPAKSVRIQSQLRTLGSAIPYLSVAHSGSLGSAICYQSLPEYALFEPAFGLKSARIRAV
eukprot:3941686-Rhodomonas_salina.2